MKPIKRMVLASAIVAGLLIGNVAMGALAKRVTGNCDTVKGCQILKAACTPLPNHTYKSTARDDSKGECTDNGSTEGAGGSGCSGKTCTCSGSLYCAKLKAACDGAGGTFETSEYGESGVPTKGTCTAP